VNLNRFEVHDRLLDFNKQAQHIYIGCMQCIQNVPEDIKFPFYVHAHSRQIDMAEKLSIIEDPTIPFELKKVDERLIWMPRITKPKAEPNSYLFLVTKRPEQIRVIWLLPKPELWKQMAPGMISHHPDVWTSIQNYLKYRKKLEENDIDGPSEKDVENFRRIYGEEAHRRINEKSSKLLMDRLYKNPIEIKSS
jgi:hypothetical protein